MWGERNVYGSVFNGVAGVLKHLDLRVVCRVHRIIHHPRCLRSWQRRVGHVFDQPAAGDVRYTFADFVDCVLGSTFYLVLEVRYAFADLVHSVLEAIKPTHSELSLLLEFQCLICHEKNQPRP